jgi:hypothetical protein
MNDPKSATPKGKGTEYRAITNVGFGKDRPDVKAGELFNLDDDDQAKDLIAKGVISKNVKPSADDLAKESQAVDPNVAPEVTRETSAKGASAGGHGKTSGSSK